MKNKLRVIRCIMGNGNYTLKMADTDDYLRIIDDNREMTHTLHKLYISVDQLIIQKISAVICLRHQTHACELLA